MDSQSTQSSPVHLTAQPPVLTPNSELESVDSDPLEQVEQVTPTPTPTHSAAGSAVGSIGGKGKGKSAGPHTSWVWKYLKREPQVSLMFYPLCSLLHILKILPKYCWLLYRILLIPAAKLLLLVARFQIVTTMLLMLPLGKG